MSEVLCENEPFVLCFKKSDRRCFVIAIISNNEAAIGFSSFDQFFRYPFFSPSFFLSTLLFSLSLSLFPSFPFRLSAILSIPILFQSRPAPRSIRSFLFRSLLVPFVSLFLFLFSFSFIVIIVTSSYQRRLHM